MERIAVLLRPSLDGPLIDRTGLTGKYDILLRYIVGSVAQQQGGPSMVEAVQSQLGLKLESKRGMVEVLVIEHAEREPTEN